jgi:2-dehydro-3-deoxygluconokinase
LNPPEVVTIGETMILMYSARPEVPLSQAGDLSMTVAGADTNFGIAMTRLGHRVGWISRVGADPLGDRVIAAVEREGVDVSQVRRDRLRPTGLYFKYRTAAGEARVLYYRRRSAASRLCPDDLDSAYFAAAKLLHLNGMTLALSRSCRDAVRRAVELAVACRARISLDLNLRLQLWSIGAARRAILPLLPNVSVLLGTAEEFQALFGAAGTQHALEAAAACGPEIVVAKRGAGGALALARGRSIAHPGFAPPRVLDEVGAGDGFNAGFLAALMRGQSEAAALRQANLVGAAAVTVRGDSEAYPTQAELEGLAATWPERVPADA